MRNVYWVALILTVIGGVNWGLVGLFNLDLVAQIFGAGSGLAKVVYVLVGASAVLVLAVSCRMSCPSKKVK